MGREHVAARVIEPKVLSDTGPVPTYQHQNALKTLTWALGLTSFPGAAAKPPLWATSFSLTSKGRDIRYLGLYSLGRIEGLVHGPGSRALDNSRSHPIQVSGYLLSISLPWLQPHPG